MSELIQREEMVPANIVGQQMVKGSLDYGHKGTFAGPIRTTRRLLKAGDLSVIPHLNSAWIPQILESWCTKASGQRQPRILQLIFGGLASLWS